MTSRRTTPHGFAGKFRPLLLMQCVLMATACQRLTGLDTATFGPTATSADGASSGSAGGGEPQACGTCDGHCVGNHCCRAGGSFQQWKFAGGRDGTTARFVQFDGTGNLEAVFANTRGQDLWVHDLEPSGPVESPRATIDVGADFRGSFILVDLNGDGYVDLATNHFGAKPKADDHFALRRGQKGGFAEPIALVNSRFPGGIIASDLDGDGDLDLRFDYNPGSQPSTPALRYNLGDLQFGPPTIIANTTAVSERLGAVRGIFPLGGDATLQIGTRAILEIPIADAKAQAIELKVGGVSPVSGGLADIDGDGADDVLLITGAAGAMPNHLLTYLRNGTSTLELCEAVEFPSILSDLSALTAGDYDGDGHADALGIAPHNDLFTAEQNEFYESNYYVFHAVYP